MSASSRATAAKTALTSLKLAASSKNPVNACIRPVGTCRSVYLYSPTLTSDEMQSLGYALQTLRTNTSLSSILITCNSAESLGDKGNQIVPRSMASIHKSLGGDTSMGASYLTPALQQAEEERGFPPIDEAVLSGVSHPMSSDEEMLNLGGGFATLLEGIRGNSTKRAKIPTIYVHHGLTTDGGLIFNCASHVVCTSQSSYRVDNPWKGLSLDPIGSSFILPRMSSGTKLNNNETSFGYAKLLALSGIEIDTHDLLQMNLATHAIDAPDDGSDFQNYLEILLSEIPSYYYQTFVPKTPAYHGETSPMPDLANAPYRNRVVTNLLEDLSCGQSYQDDFIATVPTSWPVIEEDVFEEEYQWGQEYQSDFLTYGSQIVSIFSEESSMSAIMHRLHEQSQSKQVQSIPELNQFVSTIITNLETRSPLALSAINQLFHKAKTGNDPLESCINRERIVYKNLCQKDDYATWVDCHRNKQEVGNKWKHKAFDQIAEDEIEELFQEL